MSLSDDQKHFEHFFFEISTKLVQTKNNVFDSWKISIRRVPKED